MPPPAPQGNVAAPLPVYVPPPKIVLINLTKPVLKTDKKLKAFVWKKINIDFENGGQVAKKDLKAVDPAWKGKKVLWKDVKENKDITL